MPLIQARLFSRVLGMQTAINVILPQPGSTDADMSPPPVLYLLHGMRDDYSMWLRRTAVERYALEAGLAVVMPDGGMSCYEAMAHGQNYRDFIAEELPGVMRSWFPISSRREDSFIAGCSMGGCGAVKIGLANPQKYAAIGCLSSSHIEYIKDRPAFADMLRRTYSDAVLQAEARIERNAAAVANGDMHMLLWHCCGDRDLIRENALKTKAFFESLKGPALTYHFEMFPGRHDWALWDRSLAEFIRALPVIRPEKPMV